MPIHTRKPELPSETFAHSALRVDRHRRFRDQTSLLYTNSVCPWIPGPPYFPPVIMIWFLNTHVATPPRGVQGARSACQFTPSGEWRTSLRNVPLLLHPISHICSSNTSTEYPKI